MITSEESRKVGEFLKGKNLPLDLKVEILDHISEQMNYKTEVEGKDFAVAFSEIKESWKSDLILKKPFCGEKRTKIHSETIRKSDFEVVKKSAFYFLIYFAITLALMFYDKSVASNFVLAVYSAMVIGFIIISSIDFKLIKSMYRSDRRKISFLQNNSLLFQISSMFIVTLIIVNFNIRFDKYYNTFFDLISNGNLKPGTISAFFIFNFYAFGWIIGLISFLKYKKAVKFLEQKINFKL